MESSNFLKQEHLGNILLKTVMHIGHRLYLWSSDFALYLEDCLLYEHDSLGNKSVRPDV